MWRLEEKSGYRFARSAMPPPHIPSLCLPYNICGNSACLCACLAQLQPMAEIITQISHFRVYIRAMVPRWLAHCFAENVCTHMYARLERCIIFHGCNFREQGEARDIFFFFLGQALISRAGSCVEGRVVSGDHCNGVHYANWAKISPVD